MAKVLITCIGSGKYSSKTDGSQPYRTAEYYINDDKSKTIKSAYVYDALKEFYSIDKCIFIGTYGSNWHMLYEHLYKEDSTIVPAEPKNDELSFELLEINESRDKAYKTEPEIAELTSKLQPIKEAMGSFCADIVLVKYGLNNEEILENFTAIAAISNLLSDGDEIYFDITHSFRSLAFYELTAVNYFKKALIKKVKLEFVAYGMFDFSDENGGLSPIVDLSKLINVMDYTNAVDEYNRFGTGYLFGELLADNRLDYVLTREAKKAIRRMGDTISTNNFSAFRDLIKICVRVVDNAESRQIQNIVISHIFKDLADRFGNKLDDPVLLQLELAKWHFENKRFLACAITISECLLNYCASLADISLKSLSWEEELDFRKRIKNISSDNSQVGDFRASYIKVNDIRNQLAHGDEIDNMAIDKLEKFSKHFMTVYEKHFKNNDTNMNALAKALK
ncbi:hypothetical protein FACS1894105_00460 [Clostridia bacterium]|nr:hypothetical protein FACS1894105_00460 [Clostridia bacterium]